MLRREHNKNYVPTECYNSLKLLHLHDCIKPTNYNKKMKVLFMYSVHVHVRSPNQTSGLFVNGTCTNSTFIYQFGGEVPQNKILEKNESTDLSYLSGLLLEAGTQILATVL